MKHLTDAELIAAFKDGVESAFNELVRRYQEKVYWMIRRIVRNHDDASDLAQDVFVKAYHSLKDFRGEAGLYTWLYRIGTNLSLNHLRRRKLRSFFSLDELENVIRSTDGTPDVEIERKERSELIDRAIERLPAKQKLVFILRYYEEMPYEEMAKLLGKSTGGLKANYFHAIRKIEEYVKNEL